jgi:ribA/ribD-fused uncharacterized protein
MTRVESRARVLRVVQPMPADQPIVKFSGPWRFLSNFYTWPQRVVIEIGESGLSTRVETLEHAYQAMKMTTIDDARKVLHCLTPAAARRLGRTLPCRPDWDSMRVATMRGLIAQKFSQRADDGAVLLADRLVATGTRELIEGNTWGDRFWGMTVVTAAQSVPAPDATIYGGVAYTGHNWLGQILMERRAVLAKGGGQ